MQRTPIGSPKHKRSSFARFSLGESILLQRRQQAPFQAGPPANRPNEGRSDWTERTVSKFGSAALAGEFSQFPISRMNAGSQSLLLNDFSAEKGELFALLHG